MKVTQLLALREFTASVRRRPGAGDIASHNGQLNAALPFHGALGAVEIEPSDVLALDRTARNDARTQGHGEPLIEVRADCARIAAGGRVGFLQSGNAAVEVYPKWVHPDEHDLDRIRADFAGLLSYSRVPGLAGVAASHTQLKHHHIGEWILHGMARQLAAAVQRGLPHEYVERQEGLPFVRGRLDVARQVRRNAGLQLPVWCRFDERLTENPLCRLLALFADLLEQRANVPITRSLARQARRELGEVAPSVRPDVDLALVKNNWHRQNEPFKPCIAALSLILGGRSLSPKAATTASWCVSVAMEDVFERFVARLLKEALGSAVRAQEPIGWLASKPQTFRQVPDVVIVQGDAVTIVDTKYKVPKNWRPAEADIRQVLVYAALWNQGAHTQRCRRVVLLYPRAATDSPTNLQRWQSFLIDDESPIEVVAATVPFGRRPQATDVQRFGEEIDSWLGAARGPAASGRLVASPRLEPT